MCQPVRQASVCLRHDMIMTQTCRTEDLLIHSHLLLTDAFNQLLPGLRYQWNTLGKRILDCK